MTRWRPNSDTDLCEGQRLPTARLQQQILTCNAIEPFVSTILRAQGNQRPNKQNELILGGHFPYIVHLGECLRALS